MPAGVLRTSLAAALVLAAGCETKLPDPDHPGAVVLRERCAGCHGLYPPGSMTLEMWKVQIENMRRLYAQRGMPWLTPAEERALLDYVTAHAGTR